MAIPDAVQAYLDGISDSDAVASHPFRDVFYSIAETTVNVTPWRDNASLALALVTAHLCLLYPANSSHIDRTPVAAVPGSDGSIQYTDIDLSLRDADMRTTAPGRQYLTLRKRLLPLSFSPVA